MLPNNQKFYRPYETYENAQKQPPRYSPYKSESDSESESDASDTDSGSVTTTTSSKEHLPNFVEFATKLELNETGGQNFPTTATNLEFGVNELKKNVGYSAYNQAFNITLPFDGPNYDLSYAYTWKGAETRQQPTTSMVMLNSRDRDRNVYPTPSALTLRLPRVYQNITSIQVVQMKLLSSFLYFRADKNNISMTINEFGRILYNYLGVAKGPLNITKKIREGTYNINSLIAELNTQLNTPPIFFDYPGGFNQFVPLFVSTGDFGAAFNYPGDFFYDSLNRVYTAAPTKTYIITRYWPTTTLGFTPSLKQTKVAYYYPVLREYVLDPEYGIDKLNTNINTSALLPNETIYSRIVYAFQGVNDIIIQQMIDVNVTTLDIYRSAHTFRQDLINKYVVAYETFNSRIYIQTPSLSTSLVNLLNTQYAIFLAQQLAFYNLTAQQYQLLQTLNSQLLSALNAMYDYIQTQMAIYYGINFNTFAPIYFTQPNNYINIQNALNAIGVSSNYDTNVIANSNDPFSTNIIEFNRQDPPKNAAGQVLWPNMSNLPYDSNLGMLGYPTNLGLSNTAPFLLGSNHPYDIELNDFDLNSPFINSNGDVTIDIRRKAGDIICPIDASRYTVFRFRSLYRQTLQVETMPRPTQYRYPAYNAITYNSNIQTVFDNSYSFVFNSSNAKMDNVPFASLSNIYGFTSGNTNFGISYAASKTLWGAYTIPLDVRQTVFPFVFYLPLPPNPSPTGPAYTHQVSLSVVNYPSGNLPALLKLFLYQDRASLMADLSGNARNESPLRYKEVITTTTSDISGTLTWTAYAGQTYYAILRSANISFQSMQAQLVLYYPDGNTYTTLTDTLTGFDPFADPYSDLTNYNYAQVNDPNFIKLPTASNLWGINPTGNEVNRGLAISNVAIGYDLSGVSTDLTDYVGFVPNQGASNILPTSLVRCDPTSGYFFQAGSPYNTNTQSYFYSGSSNFILTPINQSNYTPTTVPYRQYKIVQWYDSVYIPDPTNIVDPIPSSNISSNVVPYDLSSTYNIPISNYDYDITTKNIQLGLGCCGFSFVPSDGLWSMDKVMFRSAFVGDSNDDRNNNIAYLGVFITNVLNATPNYQLSLSNAIAKLDFSSRLTFSDPGDINFGFDGLLGTYYEFDKDPTFTQQIIAGFDQNAFSFTNSANDFYSIVPFDASGNITYMRSLTGSLTPYPYVCDASASEYYFDGKAAPNRRGIVVPGNAPPTGSPYGPPSGISYSMSAYEQSVPIGTQILHYLSVTDIIEDISGFQPWSGINYIPSQIYADVSGVLMVQSTDFKFYSYPYNTTNRTFTYMFSLTADDIYPAVESISLVAAAGNSTSYAFLGFKVVGGQYEVHIKAYDVGSGTLIDIGVPSTFVIPDLGFSVVSFSFTNNYGFVISGSTGSGTAKTYRTPNLATPFFEDTYPAAYTSVKSVQPPSSSKVYSLPITATGSSSNVYYANNENDIPSLREIYTVIPDPKTPTTYSAIAATTVPGIGDQVLFLTQENLSPALSNSTARFYKVRQVTGTAPNYSAKVDYSELVFTTPADVPYAPLNLVGGALGSRWAFFNQPSYLWGHRNDNVDAPLLVQNAWQMFYPTFKVVLRKLANAVNPITDLSGLQYPEFPHTEMFVYNTQASYSNQINNSTNPKWGFESSGGLLPTNAYNLNSNGFLVSDVSFSGYYFNSYIFNVPLLPNSNTGEPYYYLTVRNYTPSEKSQVLLRFNMPQRYDFGFVRLRDLSNEPVFATTSTSNAAQFNPSYYNALLGFNSNFILSNVNFGYNPSQNIPGSNITSAGFGDFLRQYTAYFNLYTSNVQVINTITSNVNAAMQNYINTYLTYILPDYAKTRQNYTQSITFSILWRSALTPTYLKAEDDWGLGYNLGYAKVDTNYASIHRAESFFKILDDYIYLKLNQEYDMNRMDFGGKENLKETNEPTGSILGYNGKLLLNTFGSYAQTIIQNPVYFNPPLLKLDKLSFNWYDTAGTQITNAECEWNAAIQIVETTTSVNLITKNPVIIPPGFKNASKDFTNTGENVRFGNE